MLLQQNSKRIAAFAFQLIFELLIRQKNLEMIPVQNKPCAFTQLKKLENKATFEIARRIKFPEFMKLQDEEKTRVYCSTSLVYCNSLIKSKSASKHQRIKRKSRFWPDKFNRLEDYFQIHYAIEKKDELVIKPLLLRIRKFYSQGIPTASDTPI